MESVHLKCRIVQVRHALFLYRPDIDTRILSVARHPEFALARPRIPSQHPVGQTGSLVLRLCVYVCYM